MRDSIQATLAIAGSAVRSPEVTRPLPVIEHAFLYLSPDWQTVAKIHQAMGCWAPVSVKNALNKLCDQDRAERRHRTVTGASVVAEFRLLGQR